MAMRCGWRTAAGLAFLLSLASVAEAQYQYLSSLQRPRLGKPAAAAGINATQTSPLEYAAANFRLDAAVPTEAAPTPSAAQVTAFRTCLGSYSKTLNFGRETESTRQSSILKVAFQQNAADYQSLHSHNAQTRGVSLKPLAFVQPSSTAAVAAVVKCARSAGLHFTARNGGHHYEANSLLAGGVVIDLLKLQHLNIDDEEQTVVLGGGQKLGPVYAALTSYGYTFPGGTCVGVGVSGITLGGGIGHATRVLGVLADSVLSATVVLANGTVVEASDSRNPDLLWAIRGGGPLYGIVTSWKFRLHKAPPKVSVVKYRFRQGCTQDHWANMLTAWYAWKPWELPKDYALVDIQCGYGKSWVQVWYWGPLTDALKTVTASPVFQLPGGYSFVQKEYTYADFLIKINTNLHETEEWKFSDLSLSSTAQDQGSFVAGSLLPFAPMSKTAIAVMAKAMGQAQSHAFIQGRAWGGQVTAVGNDYNAFPWRGALGEFQVYSSSGTRQDRAWVTKLLDDMHPLLGNDHQYYNYFQCNNKDPWTAYFGSHAARLQGIKKAYDPLDRIGGLYCQAGVVYA